MKAHEAVIRLFDAEGIETIFALMSEDTMRTLSTVQEHWSGEIRVVHSRHEQGAVAMADGYSRAGDDIGVCIVGRGPAIAQTGTSLVTARKKGSKLLVIVPEPQLSDTYDIKAFEQESYLESTVGTVRAARSADTLLQTVAEAFRSIRTGEGPIAVQVPWDILDGEIPDSDVDVKRDRAAVPTNTVGSDAGVHPDEDTIDAALDLYLDSDATKIPIAIAGRGAIEAGAKEAIESFAERTNSVLATTLQARGYFDDHPFSVGFTGDFGSNIANKHFHESDFVLAVGCSLTPYTTDSGHLIDDETKVVHIDTDVSSFGRFESVDLGVRGDARLTVEALTEKLEEHGIDRDGEFWTDRLETRIAETPTLDEGNFPEQEGRIDPRELVRGLDRFLPENRLVISDGGHFSRWVLDGISTPEPGDLLWTLDFAAIGQGLPHGIGAALNSGERAPVAVCGDAGFMMALQEIDTAVRHEVPMTIVVMNDSALGTEYHSLLTSEYDADVALVESPDVADVAQSLGADGYTVRSSDDLEEISAVLSRHPDGPVVVDCKTNSAVRHRSKI
ncbi:thiamine pyrophosphate-binding protein [Natrinema gelatinilyticum]|uniref:thiamine pyrophosphate-binding protein n=1 Tax=Natrinema gelatinilyticum TaxID=2961571 RepID=UPI0020C5112E|nr:thiamine pyrophosphate-binding protein [Natrinema gelatinilyticum]